MACDLNNSQYQVPQMFTRYIFSWYFSALTLLGLVGSSLCLLIIVRYRVFSHGTRFWFISLTASDLLTLAVPALDMYLHFMLEPRYSEAVARLGFLGCELRFSVITFLGWTANTLQAGLSIERTISVVDPIRSRVLFTTGRTKILISVLIGGTLLASGAINMLTLTRDASSQCIRTPYHNDTVLTISLVYYIDLVMFRAVPFSVMLLCSVLIMMLMRTHTRRRDQMIAASSASSRHQPSRSALKHKEVKMSILLIAMNTATLLTNPLFLVFELIDGAGSEGHQYAKVTHNQCLSDMLAALFNSLIYFNNQTNWIFYVLIGAKFRYYFLKLFHRLLAVLLCCVGCCGSSSVNVVKSAASDEALSNWSTGTKYRVRRHESQLSNSLLNSHDHQCAEKHQSINNHRALCCLCLYSTTKTESPSCKINPKIGARIIENCDRRFETEKQKPETEVIALMHSVV